MDNGVTDTVMNKLAHTTVRRFQSNPHPGGEGRFPHWSYATLELDRLHATGPAEAHPRLHESYPIPLSGCPSMQPAI